MNKLSPEIGIDRKSLHDVALRSMSISRNLVRGVFTIISIIAAVFIMFSGAGFAFAQTIDFTGSSHPLGADFNISAVPSSSGAPTIFTIDDASTGICLMVSSDGSGNGVVHPITTGNCIINADQAAFSDDDGNHFLAANGSATFTITEAAPIACPEGTQGVFPVCLPIIPAFCPEGQIGIPPACSPIELPQACTFDTSVTTLMSDTSNILDGVSDAFAVHTFVHSAWLSEASAGGAIWIWNMFHVADPSINEVHTFTKTFSVEGTPLDSSIDIAADNGYSVSVNGHAVCSASTDSPHYGAYTSCGIPAALLQHGDNTLVVTATNLGVTNETNPEANPAGVVYKLTINKNSCVPVVVPTTGTLTIVKNIVGGEDGTFSFHITQGDSNMETAITTHESGGNAVVELASGIFNVTEDATDNWTLTDVSCDSDVEDSSDAIENGKAVTITAGHDVECVFTNTYTSPVVETPSPQCSDGIDNDEDGQIDTGDSSCHTDHNYWMDSTYDPLRDDEHAGDDGGGNPGPGIVIPGGGNGPIFGGSFGGGSVIPNGGSVLGASTSLPELPVGCTPLISSFMRGWGFTNNTDDVKKLQQFLNGKLGLTLPIDGIFGTSTETAVKQFQTSYAGDVLAPWGISSPTGFVYLTTQRWINLMSCSTLNIPMPKLVPYIAH